MNIGSDEMFTETDAPFLTRTKYPELKHLSLKCDLSRYCFFEAHLEVQVLAWRHTGELYGLHLA